MDNGFFDFLDFLGSLSSILAAFVAGFPFLNLLLDVIPTPEGEKQKIAALSSSTAIFILLVTIPFGSLIHRHLGGFLNKIILITLFLIAILLVYLGYRLIISMYENNPETTDYRINPTRAFAQIPIIGIFFESESTIDHIDYEEYERRLARYQRSLYAGNLMASSLLTTAFCLFAIVWYNPFPTHFNVIYQDLNLVSISTPEFKSGDVQDAAIKEIQKKLTKFSFYNGPINGCGCGALYF